MYVYLIYFMYTIGGPYVYKKYLGKIIKLKSIFVISRVQSNCVQAYPVTRRIYTSFGKHDWSSKLSENVPISQPV